MPQSETNWKIGKDKVGGEREYWIYSKFNRKNGFRQMKLCSTSVLWVFTKSCSILFCGGGDGNGEKVTKVRCSSILYICFLTFSQHASRLASLFSSKFKGHKIFAVSPIKRIHTSYCLEIIWRGRYNVRVREETCSSKSKWRYLFKGQHRERERKRTEAKCRQNIVQLNKGFLVELTEPKP